MGRRPYPHGYSDLHPNATYSPWQTDEDFCAIYHRIADHTMVDQYRCYSLYQLALQTRGLQGDILEVGVWRGGTSALLADAARRAPEERTTSEQISSQRGGAPHIWIADTFRGVVKAGRHDPYYKGGEHANTSQKIVENLLRELNITDYTILCGIFPEEVAASIGERHFRLCHIDVDVYQSAHDILEWVWPRICRGGVVVFDDYGFYGCEGVTKLVNDTKNNEDRLFIYNINGQALFVKRI